MTLYRVKTSSGEIDSIYDSYVEAKERFSQLIESDGFYEITLSELEVVNEQEIENWIDD
jgi:hypothetical protein